ncbi:MAG: hypothetical protein AAF266_01815 [Planctomycetota bacterium]
MKSDRKDHHNSDFFRRIGEMLDREGLTPRDTSEIAKRFNEEPDRLHDYIKAIELHALLEGGHGRLTPPDSSQAERTTGTSVAEASEPVSCNESVCGAEIAELLGLFDEAAAAIDLAEGLAATTRRFPLRWLAGAAIAATLLIAFVVSRPTEVAVASNEPVGVLTNATGARWSDSQDARLLPERVIAGQEIALERGVAELTLTSGVVVVMRGPARIDVVSPMCVRAQYGAVRARVGESAKGFLLETPTTNVIDLGTEFGVDIDPESGDTDVVVFDGKIDLKYVGLSTPSSRSNARRAQPLGLLEAGEGLHVASTGVTSRIVSIHSGTYPEIADGVWKAAQTPLITGVSDSLRSPDATRYYQVVHGGFREDARAFVDRRHEWNGDTDAGLPPYLIGGDYIQTFNSDKLNPDLQISIELSAPATLYVLFDRRATPPDWLVEQFEPTGDFVGVDEEYRDFKVVNVRDIGPGASIDTRHSVWRRRIDRPSTVALGGLPDEEIRTSMYGIVAQPLPAAVDASLRRESKELLSVSDVSSDVDAPFEATPNSVGNTP